MIGVPRFQNGSLMRRTRNLRSLGVDVKLAQELLRRANSRITMDVYTRAVSARKRKASGRVLEMMLLPKAKGAEGQHPSAPLESESVSSIAVNQ
jgi:hypothetical protein